MSGQPHTSSRQTLVQDTICLFPPPGSTKLLQSSHPQRDRHTLDIPQPLKGSINSLGGRGVLCHRKENQNPPLKD